MTHFPPDTGYARLQPTLTLLQREACLHIHRSSCEILRTTGFRVYSEMALKILREAGAVIADEWVRLPASLVEWALGSTPRSFNLYQRGSDAVALRLDGAESYFGPGSDTFRYLDPRSGERREFLGDDVADCIRLCDALPEIDFVMSVGVPADVPADKVFRHQFATMLRNTRKPIVFVCDGISDIEAIVEMAAVVAGGMERLSAHPNILLYSEPTSPLQHAREATDKLLFCAENGLPVTHSPAPMMGGTAPVTLAGAVALGNAEVLSGLVMHQLKNSGAPFLYGHGVHHLDMKTMVSVYGAPEFQLARVMTAEMGRFYGLPVWGYAGHSDSKVVDGQAAADAQFSVLVALLAKTNLNHDVGYLESGLTNSPELMVLTDEIITMTRRFTRGVRLDEEAFALPVIDEVGPAGDFLSHDHTLAHWNDLWYPKLFDRDRLPRWLERGSRDINARLRERTLDIMDSHTVEPLSDRVEGEITAILNR